MLLNEGLAAKRIEEKQRSNRHSNRQTAPANTPEQGALCFVVGIAFFQCEELLKLTQRQDTGQEKEHHSAKKGNDYAIGHLVAGTGAVIEKHQYSICFKSELGDQVGQQCKQCDQADNQPGLPAQ